MSLLSFEPFFRDDIYVCISLFRVGPPQTISISAYYADLSPSKNFFSRQLSPDKTRKSHLDFLALVRIGIGHGITVPLSDIDWSAVRALAERQGLYAVALDGIEKLPSNIRPPQDVLLEWIGEVLQGYEHTYEDYCNTIGELAGFYNSHGYKMMVLKGYACSLDWPKPNHRPCGDIDIWLFGEQKKADEALQNAQGPEFKIDKSHQHHTIFTWRDFMVENHYDFINAYRHKSNEEQELLFKELGKDDSFFCELNGEKVYLPSPNLHSFFLLRHMVAHFVSSEISIRNVMDWAFYVQNHRAEINWDWLLRLLDKYGMTPFFQIINAICVEDLGFNSRIFPTVQFLPDLKERVKSDILHPEFSGIEPKWLFPRVIFKFRRWKANEWKQRLCYKESMISDFWTGVWNHLLKPASI